MHDAPPLPPRAGLGLKAAHLRDALAGRADVGYFEVHAENCMVEGGPWPAALDRLGERHALSLHGVGLSLGGRRRPDRAHLRRLARVIARHRPRAYSEHLAWSGHGGRYHADLLPLCWDEPTLARVAAHVDETQQALGLRLLVENPATYLTVDGASLGEAQFIAELVARTGCALGHAFFASDGASATSERNTTMYEPLAVSRAPACAAREEPLLTSTNNRPRVSAMNRFGLFLINGATSIFPDVCPPSFDTARGRTF